MKRPVALDVEMTDTSRVAGIQERLSTLGGTMNIESTRGKTRVSVSLHCS